MLRYLAAAALLAMVPGWLEEASRSPPPGAVAAGQVDLPGALLRFTHAPPEQLERSGFQYACVGTFVTERHVVTAAHCLTGREGSLTVACESRSGELRVGMASVVTQEQHPTHDVRLLEFEELAHCDPVSLGIASQIASTEEFFVVEPGSRRSAAVGGERCDARRTVIEKARTAHTIDVIDRRGCMARGDSGTPLLVQHARSAPAMIGILIGGLDDWPDQQTYVRLDGIRGWIVERL